MKRKAGRGGQAPEARPQVPVGAEESGAPIRFVPNIGLAHQRPFKAKFSYRTRDSVATASEIMVDFNGQSEDPVCPELASTTDSTFNCRLKILWNGLR